MKFLTMLNEGCVELCLNMLASAERVGIPPTDFLVACLDQPARDALEGHPGAFLARDNESSSPTAYQTWSLDANSGFRRVVRRKWGLVAESYRTHKSLTWVDTDIVFRLNPVRAIQNNDLILFQSDRPGHMACTGFFVLNASDACERLVAACSADPTEDDQVRLNMLLPEFADHVGILQEDYFPNGHVYYVQGRKGKAAIVHNNHMNGLETKKRRFQEEGLWFL